MAVETARVTCAGGALVVKLQRVLLGKQTTAGRAAGR